MNTEMKCRDCGKTEIEALGLAIADAVVDALAALGEVGEVTEAEAFRSAIEKLPRYDTGQFEEGIEEYPLGDYLWRDDVLAALDAFSTALPANVVVERVAQWLWSEYWPYYDKGLTEDCGFVNTSPANQSMLLEDARALLAHIQRED